ncbi:hypothetical protein FITA111629_05835 [Filibacter tadaridae]|uniref:Uncharacterized protein n=1 Tax=Filibacter tadaridae TaxID=2483811 RepID=A0A3P5WCF5_9BACL|nr:hypothetical protein [Filibacter tadaridae]VDC19357.1 hypothetical protein FILTAD_00294 [Filibacter tadaridae]
MADMQLREKMRTLADAVKHGEHVPERSKSMGLIVFLILFGIGMFVLLAFGIGLVMNGHPLGAVVSFIIVALLTYSVFKMMKADDIRDL